MDDDDTVVVGVIALCGIVAIISVSIYAFVYVPIVRDDGPIVRDVFVEQKVKCIENGQPFTYLRTSVGRINCSEYQFDYVQIEQPMDLQLYPIAFLYNDDPMRLWRIENAPCEVVP